MKLNKYSLVAMEMAVGETRNCQTHARAALCANYGNGVKMSMKFSRSGTKVTRLK